jgi:hypothetical protein
VHATNTGVQRLARLVLWCAAGPWLLACGDDDRSSPTGGAASGDGAAGNADAGGSGGAPGGGGSAATSGSGAAPAVWSATPEWTNLPLPLQFGPSLAAHPVEPQTLTILASAYAPSGTTLIAATSSDLGTTFPQTATLSPIGQTSMPEAKGIAYNPKNPSEISAVVWIQGPPEDPAGGGHLYRSTDGGQSFTEAPLAEELELNALAFTSIRYTSSGALALRVGASIVYSLDGATVSDTVDTSECAAQPGSSAFDVDPTDDKRVAVPCGSSVAFCSEAGPPPTACSARCSRCWTGCTQRAWPCS